MDLKDSSGVDVAADIFDELVRYAAVSFKVVTEDSGKEQAPFIAFTFRAFSKLLSEGVHKIYLAVGQETMMLLLVQL